MPTGLLIISLKKSDFVREAYKTCIFAPSDANCIIMLLYYKLFTEWYFNGRLKASFNITFRRNRTFCETKLEKILIARKNRSSSRLRQKRLYFFDARSEQILLTFRRFFTRRRFHYVQRWKIIQGWETYANGDRFCYGLRRFFVVIFRMPLTFSCRPWDKVSRFLLFDHFAGRICRVRL